MKIVPPHSLLLLSSPVLCCVLGLGYYKRTFSRCPLLFFYRNDLSSQQRVMRAADARTSLYRPRLTIVERDDEADFNDATGSTSSASLSSSSSRSSESSATTSGAFGCSISVCASFERLLCNRPRRWDDALEVLEAFEDSDEEETDDEGDSFGGPPP
uniref:Putative secreted peptide n=1 Tax=Anopheles braziliensis TaxID=58242 RepID=A0A2M3ZNI5_9DIPT